MYLHWQALEDARTLCSQLLKIITKQTNETTLVNRCGVVRRIGRSGLLTKEPLPDEGYYRQHARPLDCRLG